MTDQPFPPPSADVHELERGGQLTPKFNADGLITAVAQDVETKSVLMLAHMNAAALEKTITTRQAWYWSRSRQKLWRKGETSGYTQAVEQILIDCDQDAVVLLVRQQGPACHTGAPSCFYRQVDSTKSVSSSGPGPTSDPA